MSFFIFKRGFSNGVRSHLRSHPKYLINYTSKRYFSTEGPDRKTGKASRDAFEAKQREKEFKAPEQDERD